MTNNILGGVCYNDSPHDAQLYLLSGNSNAPYLFDQDFFPAFNANSQENAVVTLKGGLGFALDVNNGVIGFTYGVPSAPAVTVPEYTAVSHSPNFRCETSTGSRRLGQERCASCNSTFFSSKTNHTVRPRCPNRAGDQHCPRSKVQGNFSP